MVRITRILLTLAVALASLLLSSCAMSQERIEADFRRDKEDILIVKKFLVSFEYPVIRLSATAPHYQMWISSQGNVTIENDEVVAAIGRLRENRYGVIIKNNNLVEFQRWATMDASRGVLYSIDGSDPNEWNRGLPATLIEVIPLPESGWFYYVSNTIEWNRRHQQR